MDWRVVQLVIKYSSSVILYGVFHSCDEYNNDKWHGVESWVDRAENAEDLGFMLVCRHYEDIHG
jgi:hypothetical protein